MKMIQPKVIFLDAVGTLFTVRTSVGQVYAELAENHGIHAHKKELNSAFRQVFAAATSPAFPSSSNQSDLKQLEKQWWATVVRDSFQLALPNHPLEKFDQFFDEVFDYFATAAAWKLYPETYSTLAHWQSKELQLGIISNFDSRLFQVLDEFNLRSFFSSVTLSTQVGAAKPSSEIFKSALSQYSVKPQETCHIGDSWEEDYQGAIASGIKGIWLNRNHSYSPARTGNKLSVPRLDALNWDNH